MKNKLLGVLVSYSWGLADWEKVEIEIDKIHQQRRRKKRHCLRWNFVICCCSWWCQRTSSTKSHQIWSKSGEPDFGEPRFETNLFHMQISSSPPPIRPRIGGGTLLICISMKNESWKKFLHWKSLGYICSSGLKQNHQSKSFTCDFKNFSNRFFPFFEHFLKN